jgi:hypothetical protein
MPQKYSQKLVNTFIKGLVTEASEMTFPENATSDELNCDLLKNGARRRRKAIQLEENFQASPFDVPAGTFVHEQTWANVSGLSGVEYLVLQVNDTVYFYDKSFQTLSAGRKSFSIDLNTYSASNSFSVAEEPIQCSSISGYLVMTSAAINPIKVKYVNSTTIEVSTITINVRDLEYQYKGTVAVDKQPTLAELGGSTTTDAFRTYKYDLYNIGWSSVNTGRGSNAFDYWDSERTDYPSRNKPWWIGKSSNSEQSTDAFRKIDAGNNLAPNGRYILDLFSKNRSAISGITGLATIVETARFRATAPYAGRVWYAGLDSAENGGKIFFSRVIQDEGDLGKCYQTADPTAEDSAGVVDSDGGFLLIPDAANIRALFPMGSTLLVMAQNGIWQVGGVDQVFKATEFFVKKISPFGISSARSLVDAMGMPIFWDTSGIYTVTVDGNQEVVQQISQPIKQLFEAISNDKKAQVEAVFDRLNKRVYWMYPSNDETVAYKFNNILVLDLDLGAFFPWSVSDQTTGLTGGQTTPYVLGGTFLSGFGSAASDFGILVDEDTVLSDTDTVIATIDLASNIDTDIKFIVKTATGKLTFASFRDRGFKDWGVASYDSFAETGYDFMGDATLKKNAPYITTYMRRTEENFVADGAGYTVDYPSSCYLVVKWDFSGDVSRWSDPSQLYRLVNYPIVNPSDLTFAYPYDTIVSRTKVRGKGRALRLKFYSEEGKDFYLVGWEQVVAGNPRF